MLELRNVTVSAGHREILRNVDLVIEPGSLTVLLGPNGAGKTTLLRVMAGELRPIRGFATLDGREISAYGPLELARRRCVLSQKRSVGFAFTAREVVSLGRYAYGLGDHQGPGAVEAALACVGAAHLSDRAYDSLSGGEAMKVDVARVLAQGGNLVLLDEPTNHLDPGTQYDVLSLFHEFTKAGATVVAALHDLNHAALFADRILLMKDGEIVADGLPSIVLDPSLLANVYGLPCSVVRGPNGGRFIVPLKNN